MCICFSRTLTGDGQTVCSRISRNVPNGLQASNKTELKPLLTNVWMYKILLKYYN
jgi:hypothetical protein